MATYFIRPAKPEDIPSILKFVVDLATYEKEPDSAKATPELLRENIFEKEYAHTLLAFLGTPESPGEAVGFALYFFNFSTWTGRPGLYLEDLYVSPESRGLGLGKALFRELGKIAQEKKCARLDWSVLKWNTPSIKFYETTIKAIGMVDWMSMRIEEQQIADLQNLSFGELPIQKK